jgi:hypothetical protein
MSSKFFTFTVILTSGQAAVLDIEPAISINDAGKIAFVGSTASGQGVFVSDVGTSPTLVSFPMPTVARTYGREVQINNAGKVAAIDVVAGAGSQRRARLWDSSNPGTSVIFGRSSVPPSDPAFFDSLGNFTSVSPNASVAFAGLVNPATTAPAAWNIHLSNVAVGRMDSATRVYSLGANSFFRLSCTDNAVLVGSKTGTAKKIVACFTGGVAVTIAETGSQWEDLGVRTSVCDDGRIIVFYGDLTTAGATALTASNADAVPFPLRPGRGVFASLALGSAPLSQRCTIRLAGETGNGEVDPGERLSVPPGSSDSGPDLNYDGSPEWGLTWAPDQGDVRVSVSDLQPSPTAGAVSKASVVYMANDPINGGAKAVFCSRLNVFHDAGGSAVRAGVEAPIQVARAGETLQGLSVTDLAIHDAVSGTGLIALWVNTGTSRAVLKAERNTRIMDNSTTTGPPQAFINTINARPRIDPDSPLVDYVAPGVAGATTRTAYNQIVLHATVGRERGNIRDVAEDAEPGIHYLISREGRITQVIPERLVANHAAPNNRTSIGIELVDDYNGNVGSGTGHREDNNWLTPVQMRKTARLVRDIALRHGIPLTHLAVLPSALHPATNGSRPATVPFNNQGDANYQQGNEALAEDGYGPAVQGIIAHGQILNRTDGKDDPRIFDWNAFMTLVNQASLQRFDQ